MRRRTELRRWALAIVAVFLLAGGAESIANVAVDFFDPPSVGQHPGQP